MSIPTTRVSQHQLGASGRGRMGSCPGVRIASTGSFIPDTIVTNEDLEALGCDSQWIIQRTGILERRKASDGQASSDLAFEAAIRCLKNGGVDPVDVDLIVLATITPDYLTPSTACILQQRLGSICPAFDISAACSGFVYALVIGSQFVANGSARNALIVGAEVMTRTVDPGDIRTYPLFGDGAGAVLLQPVADELDLESNLGLSSSAGLLSYSLGSEGNTEALYIPGGGSREPLTWQSLERGKQFMQMDGRMVFKWAVRIVIDSCNDVLSAAGCTAEDIDLVVLHQANIRIVDAALNNLAISKEKVFINLDKYGNTSAASIPLALDDAQRQGRLSRGKLVLLCGFGAGLSWGSALVRW